MAPAPRIVGKAQSGIEIGKAVGLTAQRSARIDGMPVISRSVLATIEVRQHPVRISGNGNTVVRGGWGAYRFVTQVNDVSAPLVTAQHVLTYNLPGQKTVMLSQLSQLAAEMDVTRAGQRNADAG